MKMEGIRGKILAVTIVVCSLWIGTFSFTLDAVANDDPMYDLTVTVVSGHGAVEPNSGSYSAGTVVTLTATPETDYLLRYWIGTDDDTSCALSNTVTMDSDKTVTVEFGLPRTIVFGSDPNYASIQYAIDAAGCGDIVIVPAGVHFGNIDFNGKNIRVTSMNPDDPMVVAYTIIQGTGAGPVVTFSGSESQSCWLDGLTITGGNTTGDGGGICGNGTEAMIANCVITNNHADGAGGGVSNCNGTIERCTITGNTAGGGGGGIYIVDCNVSVKDCDINYNTAPYGGGLYCWDSPGATITRCTISDNDANGSGMAYGGGIYVFESLILIEDCRISRNSAMHGGGGVYFSGSDMDIYDNPLLHNCLLTDNVAGRDGGAISANWSAEPVISNCTIAGNRVTGADGVGYGGGLYCSYNSYVEVINSIIWGNSAEQGSQVAVSSGDEYVPLPSTLTISYSDVEGGPGGAYVEAGCMLDWGIGTIDSDPQLVDPNGGDWHLGAGSPCIDAGDNTTVPPSVLTDLDGRPRIINGTVDMGAYEFQGLRTLYVDAGAPPGGDGRSWPTAFMFLADALFNASSGTEIMVAEGVYKPHEHDYVLLPPSRNDTFQLKNGVTIKGGYAGYGEPDPNARDIELYETILSGDLLGNDVGDLDDLSRDDNSYHVVTGSGTDATAVLDGFTITAGNANGSVNNASSGGGMFIGDYSHPTVFNCTFSGNSASSLGGGMFIDEGSTSTFKNCIFSGNSASNSGGGMYSKDECDLTLTNCLFTGNLADNGGGIYIFGGEGSHQVLTNCTFYGNTASSYGGGIYNSYHGASTLTNCILWSNSPDEIYPSTRARVSYSDIQGGWEGIGNIDSDPQLFDPNGGDWHLGAGSPCIDAGDNTAVPPSVLTDLDGNPRIANYVVDMGAYEFQGPFKQYYHVDGVNGDNTNDGFTRNTAFKTIQRGINIAEDYDTVLVWPGVYNEEIGFWGDAITVKSAAEAAVVETDYGYAFSFFSAEGPDTVLSNFVIRNSQYGIYLVNGSSPTLSNLTIVNNDFGISAYNGADPDISNCILWNNTYGDLFREPVPLQAKYSCIEEGGEGEGNISVEPGFVDANGGDYHLHSERGRYWPAYDVWVLDKVTSPCVDGGDPNVDPSNERMPNGGRINMGAYGNTAYASMSEMRWLDGDINHDNIVNMIDLALLANNWLETLPWAINEPPEVAITNPEDGATVPYNGIEPVPVEADASDIDGSVEKVEFFADGDKIGQDNDGSDGWAIGWHPESDGNFNLTAKATDNNAATTTSPIVQVQVGYVW